MEKARHHTIDRSERQYSSLPSTAFAAVMAVFFLIAMPLCASSAEPQLDWYADDVDALPAPPPAGQGAKGQACAASITLDKYTANSGGPVTVEVRIPALWRDEIDFVQINGNKSGTAVSMGNGLYVWHDTAPESYRNAGNVKVTFLAVKGKETVCTGTTSYTVITSLVVMLSRGGTAYDIESEQDVSFSALVGGYNAFIGTTYPSPTHPVTYTWDLAGESRTITKNESSDTQVKSFSIAGSRKISVAVVDAEGRLGSALDFVFVHKNSLILSTGGPLSLDVGKTGRWTVEASEGAPPYNYRMDCNSSGWAPGQSCERAFDTAGTYYLKFRADDSNGAYGLTTIAVRVREPMAVSLSCDSQAEVGKYATCTATVSGGTGPYDFTFDWGGDELGFSFKADSATQDAAHGYGKTGTFPVKVTVKDSTGQTATGSASIRIVGGEPLSVVVSCDAQAEVGKDAMCIATVVSGGKGPFDFSFDWGDGGKTTFAGVDSVSQSAGHVYGRAGTYPVSVAVRDSAGLSATGGTSVSVVSATCAPDEKVCGGECWPNFWTCCGTSGCPPGYPCCGNGCCAPGGWCVREGFCCKDGYLPCPDGKSCCTSVGRCNPSGGCL